MVGILFIKVGFSYLNKKGVICILQLILCEIQDLWKGNIICYVAFLIRLLNYPELVEKNLNDQQRYFKSLNQIDILQNLSQPGLQKKL